MPGTLQPGPNLPLRPHPSFTPPTLHLPRLLTGPSHTSLSWHRTVCLHQVSFYLLSTCRIVSPSMIVLKGQFHEDLPIPPELHIPLDVGQSLLLYSPYHNVLSSFVYVPPPPSQPALPGRSMPGSSSHLCQHGHTPISDLAP